MVISACRAFKFKSRWDDRPSKEVYFPVMLTPLLAGDGIAMLDASRCRVCALPLPASGADDGICSRRCAGRRRESAAVAVDAPALKERILAEVATVRPGTTLCPGELSHRVLPGLELPLTLLRPLIYELAGERKLRLSQKGKTMLWEKIRGPFRVSPKA